MRKLPVYLEIKNIFTGDGVTDLETRELKKLYFIGFEVNAIREKVQNESKYL